MNSLYKKIFSVVILIILIVIFVKPTSASIPHPNIQPVDESNNPILTLDENAPKAKVTFTGLEYKDYDGCLGWGSLSAGGCASDFKFTINKNDITNGQASIIVCSALVHGSGVAHDKLGLKQSCGSGDYFHGHDYDLELGGENWGGHVINVSLFRPQKNFSTNAPKTNESFSLTLNGSRRPDGFAERNEYKFKLTRKEGSGPFSPPSFPVVTVSSGSHTGTLNIPGLPDGVYRLEIDFKKPTDMNCDIDTKWCDANWVDSVHIITVTADGGSISQDTSGVGQNPCESGTCQTGFGNISTDPTKFAEKILKIGIGLAGGLALILMVIGAIRVLTSSGDQQRLNGGREMIIAAISGLLFLILAVTILRFIGLNILIGTPGI